MIFHLLFIVFVFGFWKSIAHMNKYGNGEHLCLCTIFFVIMLLFCWGFNSTWPSPPSDVSVQDAFESRTRFIMRFSKAYGLSEEDTSFLINYKYDDIVYSSKAISMVSEISRRDLSDFMDLNNVVSKHIEDLNMYARRKVHPYNFWTGLKFWGTVSPQLLTDDDIQQFVDNSLAKERI